MKNRNWLQRTSGLLIPAPIRRWSPGYPCCCGGETWPNEDYCTDCMDGRTVTVTLPSGLYTDGLCGLCDTIGGDYVLSQNFSGLYPCLFQYINDTPSGCTGGDTTFRHYISLAATVDPFPFSCYVLIQAGSTTSARSIRYVSRSFTDCPDLLTALTAGEVFTYDTSYGVTYGCDLAAGYASTTVTVTVS